MNPMYMSFSEGNPVKLFLDHSWFHLSQQKSWVAKFVTYCGQQKTPRKQSRNSRGNVTRIESKSKLYRDYIGNMARH